MQVPFLVILILLIRSAHFTEAGLDKITIRVSPGDNHSQKSDPIQYEVTGVVKARACAKVKLMSAKDFSLKKISLKRSVGILSDFTSRYSLSIIIGQCLHFPSWLVHVKCSTNIYIYVYLKCLTTVDEVYSVFGREKYFCIQAVSLNATAYTGQQGTIKHFLFGHYYNLTDYSAFIKDNGRKAAGLAILTRIGSALVNLEKNSRGVRFMTLSDVPPAYHFKIRHTLKSRSISASFSNLVDIESALERQNPNSTVSKYCRMFEKFTCMGCRSVWIPVRSQFLLSRETVNVVDIEEFNILTSLHGEKTWALLFNCFADRLITRKKVKVYPFIACLK